MKVLNDIKIMNQIGLGDSIADNDSARHSTLVCKWNKEPMTTEQAELQAKKSMS